MNPIEVEKTFLSYLLLFPDGAAKIPYRAAKEIPPDRLGLLEHRTVYQVILKLLSEGRVPSTMNVMVALGADLESLGGEAYILSLQNFLVQMGISDTSGFESIVRKMDMVGRLRLVKEIIGKYGRDFEDFPKLINEVTDADDFISNLGEELSKATRGLSTGYLPISDAVDKELEQIAAAKDGFVVDLIPCGWPGLAAFNIPRPTSLGIISGISSMGKTQFALQLLVGTAMFLYENGMPGCVAINELETPAHKIARRMACSLARIDSRELVGGRLSESDDARYRDKLEYIRQLPIQYNADANITSKEFSWQSVALHLEKGRVLGVADYLELFTDKNKSEELRVSNIVRNHRRVSWQTDSCEIFISQLNNSVLRTNSKIGGMGSARYSGAIGQAADFFIEVYNPVQMAASHIDFLLPDGMSEGLAYALVLKNKDFSIGQIPFHWTPEWVQFRDVSLKMGQIYEPAFIEDF